MHKIDLSTFLLANLWGPSNRFESVEMKKLNSVDVIIKRMIELLRVGGGVAGWSTALDGIRVDFHSDPKYASSKLLSMYGGMGSLNDVVIYRDGQVLVAESNEFDMLRIQLYEFVKN